MKFRTEIDLRPQASMGMTHNDGVFMLGSCFTDNVGALLQRDGFDVVHNPFGPLYNPCSIMAVVSRLASGQAYTPDDLVPDEQGVWHCLDFASRYQNADADALCELINKDFSDAAKAMSKADIVILTLGTAFVYEFKASGKIVGNCHKFRADCFNRRMISVAEAQEALKHVCECLAGKRVMFTVSPIRHVGDGLHANQLSKATLLLAVEAVRSELGCAYFPAYEIMMDDLRDYRFYAADMKHPSDVAVDYIYEKFSDAYFSPATMQKAREAQACWRRSVHRQIVK